MGEKQNQPFQLSFNPSLKVDFQGSRVTSDSGLLLVRELDERLGLRALIVENIRDDRRGKNTQLPLPDLLRQSIDGRLAGYEEVNDAERLSQDPEELPVIQEQSPEVPLIGCDGGHLYVQATVRSLRTPLACYDDSSYGCAFGQCRRAQGLWQIPPAGSPQG